MALCLSSLLPAHGQELTTDDPNKVKAAYLLNFVRYVTWPTNAVPEGETAWMIGIVGDDTLADTVEKTLQGHKVRHHPFRIVRAAKAEDLPPCQMVFLAMQDASARLTALARYRGKPVLTIGGAPEFLKEGGMIRFRSVGQTLRMDLDLGEARAAQLAIDTKMIEVAYEVLENGRSIKRR
jgi:hypothetical protein